MRNSLLGIGLLCGVVVLLGVGCTSVQRWTPITYAQIQANMDRTDYEVLGTTEGTSTEVSFLGPLVHVVDGKKMSLLGIKFYEDQYAFQDAPSAIGQMWPFCILFGPSVDERAYYKALAATPDADAVVGKAFERSKVEGFIFSRETSTFRGKALKYKEHP